MNEKIKEIVAARGIGEVVHFTSNHGLVGSLQVGSVVSRRQLPAEDHLAYIAAPTSATRREAEEYFDKNEDWLDFVNLSISEINASYFNFASKKWHVAGDRWWAILSFSPDILSHDGVYFATTNNIYEHVSRQSGALGLQNLFSQKIKRKGGWAAFRRDRADNLPTCEQAEVLYPKRLSLDYLEKVYVQNGDDYDRVSGWLNYYKRPNVQVVIDAAKFDGQPN
ncbi:DarT ssDNA thymidine ADP-ribosyltransferase family protein [Burkholderia ubonensis]|uniref:DarT ssDNA thymidine ADP-ribosyltransferase family protein n=1 Tax=Burkholderia ubonensis TaxID=101571 RepID=UPI000BA655FD|nr:DarT ssDNA thymidine ADP-ribosyltransferase family protein [Burkholderia ubonensis]PAJ87304.1 hypothetical protein CJO70_12330 [Burkholderia ubonensis]PAJ94103.1 hypothetical protein CJO69_12945 [Burkholderia ubonensis]PAK09902.1 hypothetical protein CJO67_02310 [Burkholderia ubonensis]RQP79780.1 DUF4433 domain-containing protein [Burkholderia ubonensis]RQP89869.1 DUF4433 domain-containing protein [Burkholderia ubonensis]